MDSASSGKIVTEAKVDDAAGLRESEASGTSESEDEDVNSSSGNVPQSPDSTNRVGNGQRPPHTEADASMMDGDSDADVVLGIIYDEEEDDELDHSGNLEDHVVKEIDAVMECDDGEPPREENDATTHVVKEGDKNQNLGPSLESLNTNESLTGSKK